MDLLTQSFIHDAQINRKFISNLMLFQHIKYRLNVYGFKKFSKLNKFHTLLLASSYFIAYLQAVQISLCRGSTHMHHLENLSNYCFKVEQVYAAISCGIKEFEYHICLTIIQCLCARLMRNVNNNLVKLLFQELQCPCARVDALNPSTKFHLMLFFHKREGGARECSPSYLPASDQRLFGNLKSIINKVFDVFARVQRLQYVLIHPTTPKYTFYSLYPLIPYRTRPLVLPFCQLAYRVSLFIT